MATYLNTALSAQEFNTRLLLTKLNRFRFVYVAPERLLIETFINICNLIKIPFVVIDEAHCISSWGHDFRPSYRLISQFLSSLKIQPVICALTATATKQVETDIINSLQLTKVQIFRHSSRRSNLHLSVMWCPKQSDKDLLLLKILRHHFHQAGIIYTATQAATEEIVSLLTQFGIKSQAYHAGLAKEERAKIQEMFLTDKLKIVVATNAFGMGIDKPNIRFVIHVQPPASIEQYLQEVGRAGRDQQWANGYLLFHPTDIAIPLAMIFDATKNVDRNYRTNQMRKLKQFWQFCLARQCRIKIINQYFAEVEPDFECHHCGICRPISFVTDQEKSLMEQLSRWQTEVARFCYLKPQQVITQSQKQFLAITKPRSLSQLQLIPGIGSGWVKKWGDQVLKLTASP